jgi:hypothetical protein
MHPSVVKVLAVGQLPDGRPYLAMERLEGETLASVIARGALPLARALEMFGDLCSAVHALHEQGLVHRDLKPENVFVVAERHAVLLDFGIAKDLDAPASTTTQEGNVRGTPAYMAPERFFGQPAGIATDVYELALVLYAMLAGRLPWNDVADPEARLQPRSLCELAVVPEALDVEIRRALSTRVQNRPASAPALLEAVRAAARQAASEPEPAETARLRSGAHAHVATQTGEPGRAVGAPRRRWPLVLGGIAGVAGAAVAIAVVTSRSDDRKAIVAPPNAPADAHAFAKHDPWAEQAEPESKAFSLVEDKLTPEAYRAESAAAVQKLANDTRLVFAVQLGELRAHDHTKNFLDKIASYPQVAALGLLLPPCVKGIASDAEWIVFGAPGLEKSTDGTLIVRGRWRRSDVEKCFAGTVKTHVAADGAKLYRVGDTGWLDFIDDHTAYVTLNTKLEAEAVHALVTKGAGPVTAVKKTFSSLPAVRALAIVVDRASQDDWSMMSLPKGTDIYGWIAVDQTGVALDLAADPHNAAAATAAQRRVQPELEKLFENTDRAAVGRLEVVRQQTAIHIRGNITPLMLGLVTASLSL